MNIKKYQERFEKESFKEVDRIFSESNKERSNALLLIVALIIKFKKILKDINENTKTK